MPTNFTIAASKRTAATQLDAGNFIPEVWSLRMNAKYYAHCVAMAICNTNWEGEVKLGSTVHVRQRPDVTVSPWTVNGTITWQSLSDPMVDLDIDKSQHFAFKVDAVDLAQMDIKIMDEALKDAMKATAIAIDTDILGGTYGDADIDVTDTQLTKDTISDWVVDLATECDDNDMPEDGRFLVLPPWAANMLMKSDLKGANLMGDQQSILRNGRVTDKRYPVAGFQIFKSRLLAVTNDGVDHWHCLFGTRDGISFASQIDQVRHHPQLQSTIGSGVDGLSVYGYEVTYPQALGHASIKK